jgi:hypothetical protein
VLRVEWAPDVAVLRIAGHDDEVQAEETRLVDADALGALRGGIGESYRRSLQAILAVAEDGLTFAELIGALHGRQGHEVNRGTVRSLLYAGGFVHRGGKWYAALDPDAAARQLRSAMVLALTPSEQNAAPTQLATPAQHLRLVAQAVRNRLSEVVALLRS